MKSVLVRYRVKADRVLENEELIRDVFEQLQRDQPQGLHYASFKSADGVSFVHVAFGTPPSDRADPLGGLEAFRAFIAEIDSRCDEPPDVSELTKVGSYGFGTPGHRVT